MWVGNRNTATYPFATMTWDSEHLLIETRALGLLPSRLKLDRTSVSHVELRRGALGVGVHFVSPKGDADGVTFWALQRSRTEADLDRLGWTRAHSETT